MFNLFKKESVLEKLQKQHKQLLKESFELSTVNRTLSDSKKAEADAIEAKILEIVAKN